ncbi:MAG: rhodanese-like domain-containing protein [Chthoniobacterales bacterium]
MKGALLRQVLLLLGLAMLPAIGQAVYFGDRAPWKAPAVQKDEIELPQAQNWGERVLWVDARPDAQFAERHIPGAIPLNEDRWSELLPLMLNQWKPEQHVVVYCSSLSCAASHEVARRLREEAGLPNVSVLHGGWEAWLATQK